MDGEPNLLFLFRKRDHSNAWRPWMGLFVLVLTATVCVVPWLLALMFAMAVDTMGSVDRARPTGASYIKAVLMLRTSVLVFQALVAVLVLRISGDLVPHGMMRRALIFIVALVGMFVLMNLLSFGAVAFGHVFPISVLHETLMYLFPWRSR